MVNHDCWPPVKSHSLAIWGMIAEAENQSDFANSEAMAGRIMFRHF